MEWAVFASFTIASLWASKKKDENSVYIVDKENQPIKNTKKMNGTNDEESLWFRSAYTLIMYEPPQMFYEPKEWSHTTVLLLEQDHQSDGNTILTLPGGEVNQGESYQEAAMRWLKQKHQIDVCLPENCIHHLFTFPLKLERNVQNNFTGVWGDFYECIFRGPSHLSLSKFSLAELKQMTDRNDAKDRFSQESLHALKLYFQRQGDLRAKRRLMKGYSSMDLENYGLRSNNSLQKLVLMDMEDTQRRQAIDYTMKTDDGMAPNLLYKADIVLIGVSRAGKTPLSIFMAQKLGLKVANIPLVLELPPPSALEKINPRKVFCLTIQPDYLATFRTSRFRKEMKKQVGTRSSYSDATYVKQDLEHARALARSKGYTEIDVTGRAMEETASLIASKLQERFPELHII